MIRFNGQGHCWPVAGEYPAVPQAPHPGAFGVPHAGRFHTGIDLSAKSGSPVVAAEAGTVVGLSRFTGPRSTAQHRSDANLVMIEGASGVLAYVGIDPNETLEIGMVVNAACVLGKIAFLEPDRRVALLHFEIYHRGRHLPADWLVGTAQPSGLIDPTHFLRSLARTLP